jgi:hemerythrin
MDNMHKELISKMNILFEKNDQSAPFNELKTLLDDLAGYTIKHFNEEEAFMAKINFPGLESHKLIHQDLLKQFVKHKEKFESTKGKIPDDFFAFLKVWLKSHICGIDKKYGEFSKN